jgi:hypothetical protein
MNGFELDMDKAGIDERWVSGGRHAEKVRANPCTRQRIAGAEERMLRFRAGSTCPILAVRNSPACLPLPRPFDRRTLWISRISRSDREIRRVIAEDRGSMLRHSLRPLHVIERDAGRFVILKQQQVGER